MGENQTRENVGIEVEGMGVRPLFKKKKGGGREGKDKESRGEAGEGRRGEEGSPGQQTHVPQETGITECSREPRPGWPP